MSDNQDAVNVTQSAVNEGVIQENPVSQPVAAAEKKPGVRVKIIDSTGAPIMEFPATRIGSFSEDADKAGFEIPTSCCAGACFVCAGRIKQGAECIDIGKISVPLIDIDEDQILMCVGGIKDECFVDGEEHEVIIEKEI